MTLSRSQSAERASWVIPAVLVACTSVSILSTDLFTPSLPHLPGLLASDAERVQLTVSLNLAAYAFAQLLHGPLADRFGRRRLLLVGMVGFLIASLFCAAAQTIDGLLAGRIVQGLFASVSSVVVILIIRELFDKDRAVRIMGYYGLALGVTPALGPLIGGYVYVLAGWRVNFLLLAVLAGGVFFLVAWLLPETGTRERDALRPRQMAWGYLGLLRRRAYLRYLFPLTLMFGAFFAFVTAGPFLLIDRLGVATQDYGLYYGLLVLAFMAGSLTVTRLAGRVPADLLVRGALLFAVLGSMVLVAPLLAGHESLAAILLGMALSSFGNGLVLASAPGCLLDSAGDGPSGSASALAGSLQLAAASLAGLLVGTFHDGSAWPMALTIAGFTGVAVLGYLGLGGPRPPGLPG